MTLIILIGISTGLLFFLINTVKIFLNKKISIDYTKNFKDYIVILDYHMQKAYDIIHKDRILIYSLEAIRPGDDEITSAAKDFSKLVLKFLGPRLEEDLSFLYGNKKTLIFNIVEYFNSKFENDEVRDHAINNMMSGDNSTSPLFKEVIKKES